MVELHSVRMVVAFCIWEENISTLAKGQMQQTSYSGIELSRQKRANVVITEGFHPEIRLLVQDTFSATLYS